jgi:multiple sugar transport system ATP-binding protein
MSLTLVNLTKRFGQVMAVSDLGIEVGMGEFVVFLGPSGCGKTTVLRLIAGLEAPDQGSVSYNNVNWTAIPPQKRDVAMVFQHYALYPQRSVRENIEYPLKLRKMISSERLARLQHVSDLLGIEALWDRKPRQLSGGEAQRVALARALVREPACFLLDEPLSNLDAQLRVRARSEIKRIQRALNVTTLYVTHDQEEAIALGDRIAIMNKGRLVQVGTAENLFEVPATSFVAGFFGKPPMNLFDAVVAGKDEIGPVVGLCEPGSNDPKLMVHANRQFAMQQSIKVGVRAEDIRLQGEVGKTSLTWNIEGVVALVEGLEPECTVHCDTQIGPILLRSQRKLPICASLTLRLDGSKAHYFDVQTGMRID